MTRVATQMNAATQLLKSRVKTANDIKRTVRIPSETDGKPEIKNVMEYDLEAIDTLNVQAIIVRTPTQPPARCTPQPSHASRSPRGHHTCREPRAPRRETALCWREWSARPAPLRCANGRHAHVR